MRGGGAYKREDVGGYYDTADGDLNVNELFRSPSYTPLTTTLAGINWVSTGTIL